MSSYSGEQCSSSVHAHAVLWLFCRSDLVPLIRWNEAHGIRLFRLSSCILPWMTSYKPEELPDWTEIQAVRSQCLLVESRMW
jgi:UV DNA damage endonuclease